MAVIPLCLASIVGGLVALASPLVALWVGIFLWGGASSKHFGLMIAAIGFTAGGLSASLIRLGFISVLGTTP